MESKPHESALIGANIVRGDKIVPMKFDSRRLISPNPKQEEHPPFFILVELNDPRKRILRGTRYVRTNTGGYVETAKVEAKYSQLGIPESDTDPQWPDGRCVLQFGLARNVMKFYRNNPEGVVVKGSSAGPPPEQPSTPSMSEIIDRLNRGFQQGRTPEDAWVFPADFEPASAPALATA